MNANPLFPAVFFHRLPIRDYRGLGFGQLVPGGWFASARHLHHRDAALHRTDVVTEAAADAVLLAHARLRARAVRIVSCSWVGQDGGTGFSLWCIDQIRGCWCGSRASSAAEGARRSRHCRRRSDQCIDARCRGRRSSTDRSECIFPRRFAPPPGKTDRIP